MERRKISTLGKYSLIVTLPKDWTKMNKLQGGDDVFLKIQGDGSLIIHPEYNFNEKQNEVVLPINVNEDVKMIQRRIIGCYLNGYDKIVLKSGKNFTREQQEGIRSIVKSLYMRIYESHAHQVTLQAFMDESLASVTSGIERMHIITSSMAKDVITYMRDWDVDLAYSVISLEEDVDQFMFFLTRLLRTAVNNPSLASKLHVSMSEQLMRFSRIH
jgi:phosphate uptake regulator